MCNDCVVCKKASAKIENQRMGQLPAARVNPTPPFSTTGIDYAGPFTLKREHTRKPVLVKSYLAIFVCFATKAVHLELVSDLTTDTFLVALRRFVSRRGLPTDIHSDNGTNFIGAKNDLADLYRFLSAETTSSSIQAYRLSNRINWHCIPERAPHFGGLWEAAVKSTKHHLHRVIGLQRLDFEEFSTILTKLKPASIQDLCVRPQAIAKMEYLSSPLDTSLWVVLYRHIPKLLQLMSHRSANNGHSANQ